MASENLKTYSARTVMLITLLLLTYVKELRSDDPIDDCKQINSCSCENSKGVVDLSPLAYLNSSARFEMDSLLNPGFKYLWNPCYDFTYPSFHPIGDTTCTDVAICMVNGTEYNNLGTQESAVFTHYRVRPNNPVIQYTHRPNTKEQPIDLITSYVYLSCDHSLDPGYSKAAGLVTEGLYAFEYRGIYACPVKKPSPLSAGSIVLIVFFSVIALYLVIGVLYQKCVLNEQGRYLLPQYELWSDLLTDISTGTKTVFSCCKAPPTAEKYDQM